MGRLFVRIFLSLVFISMAIAGTAQPFANEIAEFKKQDSVSFPPSKAILFVGSSSFRMWKDVQDYFPAYTIINRGFGGSSVPDVIRYADQIILPYNPRQIVIYCGENDFAGNEKLTPEEVSERFKTLFNIIRKKYRKVPIAYVSMKPSISRKYLMPKFDAANKLIKEFLETKKKTGYIDVYHAMLTEGGSPMPDIFLEDNLHMNAKGYRIWHKIIEPYLIKNQR